ncbi:hypothetical protein HRUBRA_01691 [Pseudohaliea rubra DSM 19751]|uniref:Uncharacterized protein n=1 Tax=Pseudohaliea rubra DSM 19751 TaxID=1265313 RepID=A0A095VQH0_9GAMM|nr:hypothetical protein HRUBRA_01691 [Pseudohaliea rubra DSM 19751]
MSTADGEAPVLAALREHWREMLKLMGVRVRESRPGTVN